MSGRECDTQMAASAAHAESASTRGIVPRRHTRSINIPMHSTDNGRMTGTKRRSSIGIVDRSRTDSP